MNRTNWKLSSEPLGTSWSKEGADVMVREWSTAEETKTQEERGHQPQMLQAPP
jgi:hypothetical protein